MMLKIRQGLIFQQSLKHPGLASSLLPGHYVVNLKEGHQRIYPLLWASILEDFKVWIHEKIQLDPLRLILVRPINLVHLLHLGNKKNGGGGGFLPTKGGKLRNIWKVYP
jgi:hypothetical protein